MAKDVLEVLHRTYENSGAPDDLGNAITDIAELIAAISAERAIYAAEVRPPLDVEMDAYRRTGAALAACRGLA